MRADAIQAPDKTCEACGVTFNRKRYNGTLESMNRYRTRRFCGQSCGNTKRVVTKSAHHVRARKYVTPTCRDCGAMEQLHVHHDDRNPANNDPTNLITLCASCHLKLHWREDREQRLASARARRRPPQACVMCGAMFHSRRAKKQTCSRPCMVRLMSELRTEFYRAQRESTGVSTGPLSADGKSASGDQRLAQPA